MLKWKSGMEKVKLSSGLNKILSSKSTNEQEKGLNHRNIPAFWDELNSDGFAAELEKDLGVCTDFDNQQEGLTYFICAE